MASVVSFTPRPLYPRERAPGTHWIGGWVVPRAGLEVVAKKRIPSPRRELNSLTPIVQPVASRYISWAIPALLTCRVPTFYRMRLMKYEQSSIPDSCKVVVLAKIIICEQLLE
jgi:hypothetical protein